MSLRPSAALLFMFVTDLCLTVSGFQPPASFLSHRSRTLRSINPPPLSLTLSPSHCATVLSCRLPVQSENALPAYRSRAATRPTRISVLAGGEENEMSPVGATSEGEGQGDAQRGRLAVGVLPVYGVAILACLVKTLILLKGAIEQVQGSAGFWMDLVGNALFADALVFTAMGVFLVEFAMRAYKQLSGASVATFQPENVVMKVLAEMGGAAFMLFSALGSVGYGVTLALAGHALFIQLNRVSVTLAGKVQDFPAQLKPAIVAGDIGIGMVGAAAVSGWVYAGPLLLVAAVGNLRPEPAPEAEAEK